MPVQAVLVADNFIYSVTEYVHHSSAVGLEGKETFGKGLLLSRQVL